MFRGGSIDLEGSSTVSQVEANKKPSAADGFLKQLKDDPYFNRFVLEQLQNGSLAGELKILALHYFGDNQKGSEPTTDFVPKPVGPKTFPPGTSAVNYPTPSGETAFTSTNPPPTKDGFPEEPLLQRGDQIAVGAVKK